MGQTVNLAVVVGNLGEAPEIRQGPDGHRVATFRVATDGQRLDPESGKRVPRTEWHWVVCHNDFLTDILERRGRKGQLVFVRGSYETRSRGDGSRTPRTGMEIVVSAHDGEVKILTEPAP
ncbi:single-stranded DNA-binding protein [Gluconobacter albidus]|uniref:single-stranded DNA-binding protein n=1 Tax=Gluconobacter albidus TaxID=318683 RepID=UPI0007810A42|nr:single-stranded DNA-binding protein [Gluconobacter albidus]